MTALDKPTCRMPLFAAALALVLALALTFGAGGTAWAAGEADEASGSGSTGGSGSAASATASALDFSRTGSIGLTLEDADGNAVSGGAVTLYQVASLRLDGGGMAYELADAFANCGINLDVEDASLAESLAAYAAESGISGTQAAIGADGSVSFEGLELGLYLVVQTAESDSYETINPFVVTVPLDEDGTWVYAVDASPKVGTVVAVEPEEETPEPTPETTETETTTETTAPATGTTLPQTGQLNWPVPVLAACGLLLVVAGLALTRQPGKTPGRHAVRSGHAA